MSDYKIGILTIGYNRANNLLRLLNSINAATFPTDDVDLLISIDNSGTKDVENAANSFKWLHGRKKIYTYPERLGLRKHILKCGDFLDFYDALVVLEDDLVVAPSFYMYVLMTVNKYIENNNIAGISLYTHYGIIMRDYHLHLVLVCTMYISCRWRNHGARYGLRVNGKILKDGMRRIKNLIKRMIFRIL